MQLIAHRQTYQCNGIVYDAPAIAQKAYRLAVASYLSEAEEVSKHECRFGVVRMLDTIDYGYALDIRDDRADQQQFWLSTDHASIIDAYTSWMRTLQ